MAAVSDEAYRIVLRAATEIDPLLISSRGGKVIRRVTIISRNIDERRTATECVLTREQTCTIGLLLQLQHPRKRSKNTSRIRSSGSAPTRGTEGRSPRAHARDIELRTERSAIAIKTTRILNKEHQHYPRSLD